MRPLQSEKGMPGRTLWAHCQCHALYTLRFTRVAIVVVVGCVWVDVCSFENLSYIASSGYGTPVDKISQHDSKCPHKHHTRISRTTRYLSSLVRDWDVLLHDSYLSLYRSKPPSRSYRTCLLLMATRSRWREVEDVGCNHLFHDPAMLMACYADWRYALKHASSILQSPSADAFLQPCPAQFRLDPA